METDRLRAALGAGLLIALGAPITVLWRGGVGGVLSVAIFYVFAAALLIAGIQYLIKGSDRREKVRWAWVVATMVVIGLALATNGKPIGGLFIGLLMVCLVALTVLWFRT